MDGFDCGRRSRCRVVTDLRIGDRFGSPRSPGGCAARVSLCWRRRWIPAAGPTTAEASPLFSGRQPRDDPTRPDPTDRPGRAAAVSARAARAVRRQRLCGLDLRGRLAPAPATGDRLDRRFARRAAGDVHGRHVPGQPAAAAPRLGPAASAAGLRPARAGHRRHRARGVVRHAVCRTGVRALRRPRHCRASCCAGPWPGCACCRPRC